MKTNQQLERRMGSYKVIQRTKDGMFNATNLLKQWNKTSGNPQRKLDKFWEQDNVKEFIEILMKEENLNNPSEGYLKTRGKYGGTWMHPILFIKFAMWLNPRFEYYVIKFVHDKLIEYRNKSGDNFNLMGDSLKKLDDGSGDVYSEAAIAINYIVFDKHERMLRNKATEVQQNEIVKIENMIKSNIDLELINSHEELENYLCKMYYSKYGKEI